MGTTSCLELLSWHDAIAHRQAQRSHQADRCQAGRSTTYGCSISPSVGHNAWQPTTPMSLPAVLLQAFLPEPNSLEAHTWVISTAEGLNVLCYFRMLPSAFLGFDHSWEPPWLQQLKRSLLLMLYIVMPWNTCLIMLLISFRAPNRHIVPNPVPIGRALGATQLGLSLRRLRIIGVKRMRCERAGGVVFVKGGR